MTHMTLHGKSCEPVNSLQSLQCMQHQYQQKPSIHEYFLELFSNSNWTCFSCLRFPSSLNLALQVFKGTPGKLMERVWGPGFWANELILDWWEEALQDGFQTSKIIQAKSCVFSKSQLKVSLHPTDWQESDCSCPICGLWWWGPNVKNRRFWGWFHDSAIECFYLPGLCSHFRGTWFGEGHGVVTLWKVREVCGVRAFHAQDVEIVYASKQERKKQLRSNSQGDSTYQLSTTH